VKRRIPKSLVWKGAALVPAAAIVVHQLRYTLAYGSSAGHELVAQGHSYLTSVTPWIVLVAAVGLGALLGSLAESLRGRGSHHGAGVSTLGVWVCASLALIAIYAGQESLEGLFASGHATGIAAVLGGGGWWAIPAAHAVALVLALLLRGTDALILHLAGRRTRASRRRPASPARPFAGVFLRPSAPLASSAAGRAPPALPAQP
jgi:hypothetical protein